MIFLALSLSSARCFSGFFFIYFTRDVFFLDAVALWIRGSPSFVIIMDSAFYEGVQRSVDYHLISHNSAPSTDHRNWMH